MVKVAKETNTRLLMPKAVAVWLIENTALTFKQIAKFCNLHILEVEALANEEQHASLKGMSPVLSKETTDEFIKLAEADENTDLQYLANEEYNQYVKKSSAAKQSKYKRQSKPEAILWLLQHYHHLTDYQISKLLKSTSTTVKAIRGKTYWNYKNLHPKNPVILGLCTEEELSRVSKQA